MKSLHYATFLLLVVGGLNWFLVGLFNWDIGSIFGGMDAAISRVIYILVGFAAVYEIATHRANCRTCATKKETAGGRQDLHGMPHRP